METVPEWARRVIVYMTSNARAPALPGGVATIVYEEDFLRDGIEGHDGYMLHDEPRHLILADSYPLDGAKWHVRAMALLHAMQSLGLDVKGYHATESSLLLLQDDKAFISDIERAGRKDFRQSDMARWIDRLPHPEDLVSGWRYKDERWWKAVEVQVQTEYGKVLSTVRRDAAGADRRIADE